jgi:hypothetical protein
VPVAGVDYHIADPFRPVDGANPALSQYAGNPQLPSGATRWEYYQAETAYSLYTDANAVYNDGDYTSSNGVLRTGGPLDLIQDVYNDPDGEPNTGDETLVLDRLGSSLPSCSTDDAGNSLASTNPRRRVITAAAVDCEYWSGRTGEINRSQLNGGSGRFQATYFVEMFLLNPVRPNGTTRQLFAEVISGALNGGDDNISPGSFRNLVQLYR